MLEWSEYFYWQLLESQKVFAKSMNHKTSWDYFKVLKAYRAKKNLPIYQDLALHKVFDEMFGIYKAKSSISEWINRVPTLLENEKELNELLDWENRLSSKQKDEKKYTRSEWEQLQKLEWYKLNTDYRTMMAKLNNPKITNKELMQLTWASQRLIANINNYWITMSNSDKQKEFIEMTEEIMNLWHKRLLREIETLPVFKMQDLKALSGIVDDVFKQNRLLTGQSTENVAHWVDDIYEAILKKAEWVKQIWEWEVEVAKVIKE